MCVWLLLCNCYVSSIGGSASVGVMGLCDCSGVWGWVGALDGWWGFKSVKDALTLLTPPRAQIS